MKHIGTLLLLLLTAATGAAAYLAKQQSLTAYYNALTKLLVILLVVIASSIITRIGVLLLQRYAKTKDKGELKQMTSVYKYVVLIILILVAMLLLYGVIGPAITSIGLLAAGLTLALQRPILNIVGWFLIVAKRPFRIGDRVDIGNVGGYVHDIALMHTHISLIEKDEQTGRMAYVPNEMVLTHPIVNYTKGSALVWNELKVRVPPQANLRKVEKKLLECAEEVIGKEMKAASKKWNAEVKPEVRARIEYLASNAPYVELALRYLCNVKELQSVKSEVTKKVLAKFRNEWKA
ncbi:mechanosensitive ion channel family protein [Candidatus Woesearchaeota archaeon]|nr:mechanosensitive ion channel family protein [Candidatus Woesearchaeota archaeon]